MGFRFEIDFEIDFGNGIGKQNLFWEWNGVNIYVTEWNGVNILTGGKGRVSIPLTSQTDSCLLQAMSYSHTYHIIAYEF